ncbi:MAG: ROK family protein [Lunatimonas sp.]|uniref:ROK family protein n=1 Tax=Lunatimonas sp. TaxID=2060141 RepID=UPI00263A517C|nr:ROK family protein [Lunatimonas sp.]MCC5936814.1 ROK family protein [Lunatimonas sp.]
MTDTQSNYFLGIDVGGTYVKIGLVKTNGEIVEFYKEDTSLLRADPKGFNEAFVEVVGKYLTKYPNVDHVGIGLPGLVSKDRNTTLEIPAIGELNGFGLGYALKEKYPSIVFHLENDASAAAVGEYHFGSEKTSGNYLFITLGTGIGSALIMDGEVFKGVRGNAMEMGHMLSRDNNRLEVLIGRKGILKIIKRKMKEMPDQVGDLGKEELGMHLLVRTANDGNAVSMAVFQEVGEILGEAIVSTVRVLDVTEVYFGGGISAGLTHILPSLQETVHKYLSPYYLDNFIMKRATLENNAGILGAAALCFMD